MYIEKYQPFVYNFGIQAHCLSLQLRGSFYTDPIGHLLQYWISTLFQSILTEHPQMPWYISVSLTILFGFRQNRHLTSLYFKGDRSISLLVRWERNLVQSILNSRSTRSLTEDFLARLVRVPLAANSISMLDASLWLSLFRTFKFASLDIMSVKSKMSFFTNFCISFPHISNKSSPMDIIIGSSVWYFTRKGFNTFEMYTNTWSFAGSRRSLVALAMVAKDALVGCLLFDRFNTSLMYFFQHLAKFHKALCATLSSSTHLVAQKFRGKPVDSVIDV